MPIAPPVHNAKPKKAWQRMDELTTTQRGYGASWRRLRKIIIQRDNALCQQCYRLGVIKQFDHVDHITPKAKGGTNQIDNLECICKTCHETKTAREDSKR